MLSLRRLAPAALLVTALAATAIAAPRTPSPHSSKESYGSLVIREKTGPNSFRTSGKEWGSTFTGREVVAPRKGVKLEAVRKYQSGDQHLQTNRSVTYTNGWTTTNVTQASGTKLRITERGGRATTYELGEGGKVVKQWKSGLP